jgi:transposase InsO family protein
MLSDNGNEFRGHTFTATLEKLKARHSRIHAGRPQTNGNVEALHKTILDECWRPGFARYLYPRIEGRISHLKRGYGLRRSRLKDDNGMRTWTGSAILAYNLDTLTIRAR